MGRPLNKKYFGNRNIGTTGTGDNYGIGGEGVASVTIDTVGSYTTALPTATFSTPNIPSGVRATGIVHGNALSAATTSNGTGYYVGNVLTVAGGTKTSAATFPVAAIVGLGTPGITNGGSLYDVTNGTEGDRVTFTHVNLSQALRVRITAVSGSTATGIAVEQQGIWTGTGAFPTSMANGVNGFTATTTARSGGDNNGNGLVLSFTGSNWGVYSFGTVAIQGDYTAMPSNPASFTGGNGTGAAATITFGVSGIEVTEKGSGYTSASDAAITFSGGAAASTAVLTTDSGAVGSSTNQENAIIAHAKTTSGGTDQVADIIKQESSHRYLVRTADGIAQCKLVATTSIAEGQMYIVATDTTGSTYYVTKLTARKAILTRKTSAGAGWLFATGAATGWTMGSPTATAVQVENA